MTQTERTAGLPTKQQDIHTAQTGGGSKELSSEQLQALAKEVVRFMRNELRGELERRGQDHDRRGIRR